MFQRTRWSALGAAVAVVLGAGVVLPSASAAVNTGSRAVFVPMVPCRLFDTRISQGGSGPIAAGGTKNFDTTRPGSNFATQGGAAASDCNLPAGVAAVAFSVTTLTGDADATGAGFVRFDYTGCGQSGGAFEDGTIGVWLDDALAVIDTATDGPLVLVGSSMGGWLALLAARARPARVKGLMLIAPAPDFTERLMWPEMTAAARADVTEKGVWMRPSAYDDTPTPITRTLFEDGRRHLVMDAPIAFDGPVRIVHGQADPDVPWTLSLELAERLTSKDVRTLFVKDGDHRLSTPADLALLGDVLDELCASPATSTAASPSR